MKTRFFFVLCALIAIGAMHAVGQPTASISNVTVTNTTNVQPGFNSNAACRQTSTMTVSANITVTPEPTPKSTSVTQDAVGSFIYNNVTYSCKSTKTTTSYTVTPSVTSATVTGGTTMTYDSSTNVWTGTVPVPSASADGAISVAVSATPQDTVAIYQSTQDTYYDNSNAKGNCTGSGVAAPASDPSFVSSSVNSGNAASGNGSYLLDLVPPTYDSDPKDSEHNQPSTVTPIGVESFDFSILGGSASTPYTAFATATLSTDASVTLSGTAKKSLTFGTPPGTNSGIAPKEHVGPLFMPISCATPAGLYHTQTGASTVDLCGNPWKTDDNGNQAPDIVITGEDFTVLNANKPLGEDTIVVSQFSDGSYKADECITVNGKKKTGYFTSPGSMHIAALIQGPVVQGTDCGGYSTISNLTVTLTIPAGFIFDQTGSSPLAHVFAGTIGQGELLDYHYANPLTEVTTLVLAGIGQPVVNADGTTSLTIDLTSLGFIAANDAVYVRAHTKLSGTTLPASKLTFTTSAFGYANGDPNWPINENSTYAIQSFVSPSQACSADGLIIP